MYCFIDILILTAFCVIHLAIMVDPELIKKQKP